MTFDQKDPYENLARKISVREKSLNDGGIQMDTLGSLAAERLRRLLTIPRCQKLLKAEQHLKQSVAEQMQACQAGVWSARPRSNARPDAPARASAPATTEDTNASAVALPSLSGAQITSPASVIISSVKNSAAASAPASTDTSAIPEPQAKASMDASAPATKEHSDTPYSGVASAPPEATAVSKPAQSNTQPSTPATNNINNDTTAVTSINKTQEPVDMHVAKGARSAPIYLSASPKTKTPDLPKISGVQDVAMVDATDVEEQQETA